MVRVSWETKPSIDPDPYWIENSVPFSLKVEDCDESYFACRKQAIDVHFTLGTQRLLELFRDVSTHAHAKCIYALSNVPSVKNDLELRGETQ